jgi:MazG family protein
MSRSEDGHHFPGPGTLDRALSLVRFLRRECPWDAKQTAESLIPHLLEESHEVVDAIHDGDAHALEGELGDLLLNVAFQIVVAEEEGTLDADSVYARLEKKMIDRHPHLFGNGEKQDWEALKAAERGQAAGVLDGLAGGLDPLTKAYRIQERVAAVGFDWEDHRGPADKVREELDEVVHALEANETGEAPEERGTDGLSADEAVVEEVGDLLFAAVNLARLVGVHPTNALARANRKFRARFERLEAIAVERGVDLSTAGLEVLDAIWDEVKTRPRPETREAPTEPTPDNADGGFGSG